MPSVGITGGTFTTLGTGSVNVVAGHTANVTNVANNGAFYVLNAAALQASETFSNAGSLTISAGPSSAIVRASGSVSFGGVGTIFLTDNGAGGRAILADSGGTITLGATQTVRGFGNIASNNSAIVNNGTINADTNAKTIFIDPVATADGFVNNNLLTATNGGILQINGQFGGGVTNHATISAGTASLVQLQGGIGITGGTFTSSGTGAVEAQAGHTVYIANTVNTGTFNVQNNATLNGSGTLVNNATLSLNPGGGNAIFNCNTGTVVVTGTGTILMNTGIAGSAIIGSSGGALDLAHTIRGIGNIASNNVFIINRGLISASGGQIFIDPIAAANGFQNLGTMRAESGAQLQLNGQFGGGVTNSGLIDIDAGGTLLTNSSHQLSGGTIALQGVWNATNSSNSDVVNFRGAGTLNVSNSARVGVIANGGSLATSRLSAITTSASGRLDLTDNDLVVDYTGATPVTSIRTQIGSAYNGGPWNGSTGITSSSAAAAFATAAKTGLGYLDNTAGAFANFSGQSVDNTSILIKYTYMGDANLDGQVDISDLGILATNWQTAGSWVNGDFTYDGFVDISDLGTLATDWQAGVGSPLGPSFDQALASLGLSGVSVPEPASAVLMAATLLLARRRRIASGV